MTQTENREAWLGKAAEAISELILADYEVPPLRLSVGFAKTRNVASNYGQCWSTSCSADDVNQIFIAPTRGEEDTIGVLATITHEMIHAVDNCESGHRGAFMRTARAVGFEAPFTSSDNRGESLIETLEIIAERVGLFPHAELDINGLSGEKKQSTRQLKAECPNGSGYKVRLTRKWIDEYGAPFCPCCSEQMEVAA